MEEYYTILWLARSILFIFVTICFILGERAWRSEDNLWESVFSFHQVSPAYHTQVVRLARKHLP